MSAASIPDQAAFQTIVDKEFMSMNRVLALAAFAACIVVALAGCNREPTGQVVAVVGKDEITLQEVNAEIGNAQVPKGINPKDIQQFALQRIVERKLLANVAHERELDKTPEFLIREHQLKDALLVQQLGEQAGRSMRVPDEAALDKYAADHPSTFANREILQLDQIRFAMPAEPDKLKALEADHSMEAVAVRLRQLGIEFQRGNSSLDTAVVPPAVYARLQGLPAGEPFVIPQNGTVSVSSIIGRKPAPLTGAAARPIAVQLIRNEELSKVMKQMLDSKRATTEVKYQNGFAPPKPAKAQP